MSLSLMRVKKGYSRAPIRCEKINNLKQEVIVPYPERPKTPAHELEEQRVDIRAIFAVICVSDMARSVDWYTDLIGRGPDDHPMNGLVQWRDNYSAGIQLVLNTEKSGTSLITIMTPKMNLARKQLVATKLQLEPDIQGDFGIIAQISDPDGNRITLAEPPEGMWLDKRF